MSLDFQQVRKQVATMGEGAPKRAALLQSLRTNALDTLNANAERTSFLRDKVGAAVQFNANLRCAVPGDEALNLTGSLPLLPPSITLLAADGSQINPDRHASVDYCLVNVGAIQMQHGTNEAPTTTVRSKLLYDEQMYTDRGRLTEQLVALRRDLYERELLADLAADTNPPVITLTDGPLELWGGRAADQNEEEFKRTFKAYLKALGKLHESGAVTAGYIDRPRGDLLVRLLEVAQLKTDEINLAGKRAQRRLLGVTDSDLFRKILAPGERSAIFAIQSRNSGLYTDQLGLHFFYLNVGGEGKKAYPVRVEIPAWAARNPEAIDQLHAILVHQCKILGTRTYPYLLHRSHEVAVVTLDEKNQVERMIALELHKRGFALHDVSQKQAVKDSAGRTRM